MADEKGIARGDDPAGGPSGIRSAGGRAGGVCGMKKEFTCIVCPNGCDITVETVESTKERVCENDRPYERFSG